MSGKDEWGRPQTPPMGANPPQLLGHAQVVIAGGGFVGGSGAAPLSFEPALVRPQKPAHTTAVDLFCLMLGKNWRVANPEL